MIHKDGYHNNILHSDPGLSSFWRLALHHDKVIGKQDAFSYNTR